MKAQRPHPETHGEDGLQPVVAELPRDLAPTLRANLLYQLSHYIGIIVAEEAFAPASSQPRPMRENARCSSDQKPSSHEVMTAQFIEAFKGTVAKHFLDLNPEFLHWVQFGELSSILWTAKAG